MDARLIGDLIVGALVALGAIGARWGSRGREMAREIRALRRTVEDLEAHVHDLRVLLAQAGITPPPPPLPKDGDPHA